MTPHSDAKISYRQFENHPDKAVRKAIQVIIHFKRRHPNRRPPFILTERLRQLGLWAIIKFDLPIAEQKAQHGRGRHAGKRVRGTATSVDSMPPRSTEALNQAENHQDNSTYPALHPRNGDSAATVDHSTTEGFVQVARERGERLEAIALPPNRQVERQNAVPNPVATADPKPLSFREGTNGDCLESKQVPH